MANSFNTIVGVGSRLGNFQTACDVIGMTEVPVVSQAADIISCGISLATGDYVGAALSVGSLIPGLGQATGAAKLARGSVKVVGKAQDIAKSGKPFGSVTLPRKADIAQSGNPYGSGTLQGNLFDGTDTVPKRDNNLFINNKGKGDNLSNVPEKTSVAKKNETGAKSAKEESHKEIENVSNQSDVPTFDTGQTYSLKLEEYQDSWNRRIEYGKITNNPTPSPKTNPWPNLWK